MSDATEPSGSFVDLESLDRLLAGIVQGNREKVAGWIAQEPGCWGFLAGKAITECRAYAGRRLADHERRFVWHRLWERLEEIRGSNLHEPDA